MNILRTGAATAALISLANSAWPAEQSVWSGVYTEEQAQLGQTFFQATCAEGCHGSNLMGSGPTPNLRGVDFLLRWTDFTLAEFFELIETTMPKDKSDRLTTDQTIAAIAYILSSNGFPPGDNALGSPDTLDEILITEAP
jgi:S-disulfanyl-L-cysteine oxidoreductase SoxD